MKWSRGLKISAGMLWAHKLRTVLSLSGIVTGIAAVGVMAAIGRGSEERVMEGLSRMGTNLIAVSAGRVSVVAGRTRQAAAVTTLSVEDSAVIQDRLAGLVSFAAPAQSKKMTVKYENVGLTTNIIGTFPEILPIRNLRIAEGQIFEDQDNRALNRVAVVGQTLVRDLFEGFSPIGRTIRIGKVPFTVVGTLAEAGVDINGTDQDDQILIPLRTALRRVFNVTHLSNIFVQVREQGRMEECATALREVLRERHRLREGKDDDFTIQNQADLIRTQKETQSTFTYLTVGVASLSLAVGGVGILVVMLMSVRERVKEIGLRRALGAKRADILFQFLLEATMLSISGGILGVLLGVIASVLVAHAAGWRAVISAGSLGWAVAASAGIGLLFGTIPARKASLANPVASLRAE